MGLSLAMLAAGGCVSERVSPPGRGVLVKPLGAPASLPSGPLTQPAAAQTSSLQVRLALKPVGLLPYDGRTLPLNSPDGRYLAVQTTPGAVDVVQVGAGGLSRPAWAQDAAAGEPLTLGRGATLEGALVEGGDSERWIGRLEWATGTVTRLTPQGADYRGGVLLRDGTLIAVRKTEGGAGELVAVSQGEAKGIALQGLEPLLPLLSPNQATLGVLAKREDALWLVLLSRGGEGGYAEVARHALLAGGAEAGAARAAGPVDAMPGLAVPTDSPLAGAVVFLHPAQDRVAVAHATTGRLSLLSQGVFAASCLSRGGSAALTLTSARGLLLASWEPGTGLSPDGRPGPAIELASRPFVARPLVGAEAHLLLIGPGSARAGAAPRDELQVILAQLAGSEGEKTAPDR